MGDIEPHRGMSLADAIRLARQLGCDIHQPIRNGELRFSYEGRKNMNVNGRRKDASRALVSWLRKIAQEAPHAH